MYTDASPHDYLQCVICLELAKNAVECESCGNIYCEMCDKSLKKRECPTCKKVDFKVRPSFVARRMIGAMPMACPNECGAKSTVGNIADHLKKCPNKKYQCKECYDFPSVVKGEFIQHLTKKHEGKLIDLFDKEKQGSEEEQKRSVGASAAPIMPDFDRVAKMKHMNGTYARLGESGKYYCGLRLGTRCACCDGFCGTTSGCNCFECM